MRRNKVWLCGIEEGERRVKRQFIGHMYVETANEYVCMISDNIFRKRSEFSCNDSDRC